MNNIVSCCFFFQAEEGIRDRNVTRVQTCALPILCPLKTNGSFRILEVDQFHETHRLQCIVYKTFDVLGTASSSIQPYFYFLCKLDQNMHLQVLLNAAL